jgi:hypothetical protein
MASAPSVPRSEGGLFAGLFAEGLALMRERWFVYLAFAVVCLASAALPVKDQLNLLTYPAFRTVFGSALIALFFILPAAIRKLRPTFRLTLWRALLMGAVLISLAVITDVGILAAVIPGLILGVMLSQTLILALMNSREKVAAGEILPEVRNAIRSSFELTRPHFATSFGVVALSLAILLIPVFIEMVAMEVLYVYDPRWLYAMAPLTYLTFIYLECVRYCLIVRWFRRLEVEGPLP